MYTNIQSILFFPKNTGFWGFKIQMLRGGGGCVMLQFLNSMTVINFDIEILRN